MVREALLSLSLALALSSCSQLTRLPTARTLVFYVVVYRYALRLWRHIRAYGVTTSLYQLYHAFSKVSLHLPWRRS